ncbi:hypothetical protein [Nocardioides sp. WS12]|uniref:hypothetical protein n=1 Tax=Nocardioides sp. WS12 TaxID=2486272 RepID=UPI0015F7C5C2|nr:hypothetical protein [Nocardioides sp. WS12]
MERQARIRWGEVILVVLMVVLGTAAMVENVNASSALLPDYRHTIDAHSWLMVPVWLAACAAPLWWRRGALSMCLAVAVIVGIHVLAFGWVVRCGSGLPLSFALAFLVGYGEPRRRAAWGLVTVVGMQTLVLVKDSAAPFAVLPAAALIAAVVWGTGLLTRERSQIATQLRTRTRELRHLRDERTRLAVGDDRARLSAELDSLLDARLDQLARVADQGVASPTRDVLALLEEESRSTLDEMRTIVGELRGTDIALSPAPTVAHIDGLLARHSTAPVTVQGDPRSLPAGVELSAYRIVEHLLEALESDPDLSVVLRFDDTALEVTVSGRAGRASDVRAAVARARERALVQQGTFEAKLTRGRAHVVAHLPVRA